MYKSLKKLKYFFFSISLFAVLSTNAVAGNIIKINRDLKKLPIGQYIDYIDDKNREISFSGIKSGMYDLLWESLEDDKPNLGYKSTPYWIRLTVENTSDRDLQVYLEHQYRGIHQLTLYLPAQKEYKKIEAGILIPFNNETVFSNTYTFPLLLKAGQKNTYYLHSASSIAHLVYLFLWSPESFHYEKDMEYLVYNIFYAIMIVMALYNFILFFFIKNRAYLYYFLFLATETLMLMSLNGTGFMFLWTHAQKFNLYAPPLFICTMLIFLACFCAELVDLKKLKMRNDFPRYFYKSYQAGLAIITLTFITFFFIPHNIAYIITACVALLEFTNITVTGLYLIFFEKNRPALIGLSAGFCGLLGAVIFTLKDVGFLKPSPVADWALYAGLIIMILLFSIALADRINQMRKELQESRHKLEGLNRNLENEVRERTLDLENTNRKLVQNTEMLAGANEKLKEIDQLKSNFFANISHEIRTPLTLILSPVETLLQGNLGKKISRNFFKNIQRNALRLLRLINNILDFSKLESGKMKVNVREVDIVKMMKSYIDIVSSAAESRGVMFNFISLNETVKIFIDIEKADKVAMNLFSNSLKFTPPGGRIDIRIKDDPENCYIEVQDTGEGIPEDKLDSIFDRFTQVDSSSTRMHEGTGIGLSLVKELVELQGGKIEAESRHADKYPDDHGTTFTITVPKGRGHLENREDVVFITRRELRDTITDADQWKFSGMRHMHDLMGNDPHDNENFIYKSDRRNSNSNGLYNYNNEISMAEDYDTDSSPDTMEIKNEYSRNHISAKSIPKILIVEDNSDMRSFLQYLLKDEHIVYTAKNGLEGIERAGSIKPHIIITDVMMPGMNGYEMTKKIKENKELWNIPVLMLTAKADISEKIEGLEYGAEDYLTKPFNSKELITRIKSLLRIKKLQDDLTKINLELEKRISAAVDDITQREHEALEIIGSAAEFRDLETSEHIIRVAKYSRLLASAMGQDEETLELIYYVSPLHDVGKIGIPDAILLKEGQLSAEEASVMKKHCEIGHKILSGKKSKYIQAGAIIALTHHEKFDGTGYPNSLKGEDIHIYGRIVAVADVFDAITSRRPYKDPLPFDEAVMTIINEKGRHFDPFIVDAFIDKIDEIKKIYLSDRSGTS